MGGKRMRHEDMRAVSATEAYHAYDRCVGKCMDLTMDVSEKNGGPRQLAKRRVIVESVWPSFVVCTTVPDRRGRTRRIRRLDSGPGDGQGVPLCARLKGLTLPPVLADERFDHRQGGSK